ncbi:hypothetical protein FXO38_09583 [Capsicum annuum]|nr:hypothetical protein FXO38_09583 [Capsicum annuum]
MASKGHGNGWNKKGKKGLDNLSEGQYTPPPLPPVTTTLQPTTTNIIPPQRIPKFKEVVEYDGNGRLIISPDDNGFILAYAERHMVIEAIKPFYTEPWVYGIIKIKEFTISIKCAWNSCHDIEIQRIFKLKAAQRTKEHLYEARRHLEKPEWLNANVWDQFLKKWDTPEYRARRERAKANRASQTGGSLHTGGLMSFATHR